MKANGFTLVELLVGLFIFGLLAAAGVALLSFSVRSQAAGDARMEEMAALRRTGALLTGDLAQAAPRLWRDEAGLPRPAFVGGTGGESGPALILVRRGWENHSDAPRSSLQRVEYRLEGGRLERRAFAHVDGGSPLGPVALLGGVTRLELRYRDERGEWRERWDPEQPDTLPRAVELVMDVAGSGTVRQLFLTGAGA